MSYYFREKPRFADKLRGKSGDELLQELKQQFADEGRQWEPPPRLGRDAFERHTSFPRGFPFDDEGGFGRRSDIRSHLDDLAARHPEFADHLLGSAWGEVPFSAGSLRRGNRRPSQERPSANSVFHTHPDEDARSQASGGSASSGASGVSSHGSEPEQQQQKSETDSSPSSRKIPQYNLRNTVDIGQNHHNNMEAPQQQRNVRSMSAPPENRQNEPRFVSRVDINPQQEAQQNQQEQQQQQPQREKSPAPQQEQKSARQQSNVRQIPIFVEGRDKPVIAKDVDETDFPRTREPEFPRRQSPPQFARPSPHYQSFNRHPTGWTSHFAEPFFEPPQRAGWTNSPPSHPQFRHTQQQPQQEKPRYTYQTDAQPRPKPQAHPQQQQQQKTQQQHPQNETQQEQAPPKPRQQVQPKDPLEKVAAVQQEVDALAEQVKEFSGNSRKDKQYMYLDEMLTRELIKLDDIDTEGKDNVRTARKQAIKSIQDTISLLESKAPLPGQQASPQVEQKQEPEPAKPEEQTAESSDEKKQEAEAVKPEAMETQEAPVPEEQKAIPLPPPSSPTKDSPAAEAQPPPETTTTTPVVVEQAAPSQPAQPEQVAQEAKPEPMDATPAAQAQQQAPQEQQPMEVRQSSPAKELQLGKEEQKESQALIAAEQQQEVKEATEQPATEKPKKEPPPVPAKPNRSPKKAKKAAKQQQPEQQPVSETAIPLPAPGQSI